MVLSKRHHRNIGARLESRGGFCIFFACIVAIGIQSRAETPDGFAIYSKGNDHSRTLYLRELSTSGLGNEKKICDKGSNGGDIQGQISFDGKWVAFSRSLSGTSSKYGGNDYHNFEHWDVYIVRVDGSLPAQPKRVARGYWPSWGNDSYNDTKTLYYSKHPDGDVRAVTVSANGALSNDRLVYEVKKQWGSGFEGFLMAGPTGEWAAARWSGKVQIAHWAGNLAGRKVGGRDGCMPSVGADGKWIINAHNRCQRFDGSQQGTIGGDGSGDYHYGTSADMKWFVARTEGNYQVQNDGFDVYLFKLNATNSSLSSSKQVRLTTEGSWPDVHTGPVSRDVSIEAFWAEPTEIIAGGAATLKWAVSNATSLTLDGGAVSGNSKTVSPQSTTNYTLTAQGDNGPVSETVTVTVSQPRLTTIEITPSAAQIMLGERVTFSAQPLDQAGNALSADIAWQLSGGGTLSSSTGTSATVTSEGAPGQFTLTASSGDVLQQVTLTVIDPNAFHMKINCGANDKDVDGWQRDDNYVSNGADYTFSGSFSTSDVLNAAPPGVYESVVHWKTPGTAHTYSFPDVPDGVYIVRMHFSDGNGGERKMNYSFEGAELISNLDIDDAAGGVDKVLVRDVMVEVADGNGLQIECTGSDNSDVFEAGIEIIALANGDAKKITVAPGYAGESFAIGNTVLIEWTAGERISQVNIEITTDGGRTWLLLTGSKSVRRTDTQWGAYPWLIPQTLGGASMITDQAMFRIMDYLDGENVGYSENFSINAENAVGARNVSGNNAIRIAQVNGDLGITVLYSCSYRVSVTNCQGKVLRSWRKSAPAKLTMRDVVSAGTYLVSIESREARTIRKVVVNR